MKKLLKRIIIAMLAVAVAVCVAFAGVWMLRKVQSMWNATQNSLKTIASTVQWSADLMENYYQLNQQYYEFDYGWIEKNGSALIAHAMGGIDGKTYTNSLEAFEHNYAIGYRIFEVDFDFATDDYSLIASHDREKWQEMTGAVASEYTSEGFHSQRYYGKYTPLDYRKVIDLMIQYPDIYVITDGKYTDQLNVKLCFAQMVKYAQQKDPSVLDRIIPQIYHREMLDWIMKIHPFKSVIFTLYRTQWTPESVVEFCRLSGVGFVTVDHTVLTPQLAQEWNEADIYIGTHTINDPDIAHVFIEQGVAMLYTDWLDPAAFSN